ncbi:MAG: LemA family protein [Streptococcaceae bacterium]|jgi:hypothetical protein|nr:LemA family protein [Streptococcaceae bacterium]
MKKKSVSSAILKMMGITLLSWIFCLLISSILGPKDKDEIPPFYVKLSFILGICLALILYLGLAFNELKKRKQRIKSSGSNIKIVEARQDGLLDKANRVADAYMTHEKEVFEAATPAKLVPKSIVSIKSSEQFSNLVLAYLTLKANENVALLINQIKASEDSLANFKLTYNTEAELYNGLINSFPINLFRGLFKLEDQDYYASKTETTEITDAMLGL